MKAIILAGGLGTRLRSVLAGLPKPMASVSGKPFLEYLIAQLKNSGVRDIILSVGYQAGVIKKYFGDGRRLGVRICYSTEKKPLGTGGAIKTALQKINNTHALVMNGDSFFDIDLISLVAVSRTKKQWATLAVKYLQDTSRYGRLILGKEGVITSFREKGNAKTRGFINAGVYCLSKKVRKLIPDGNVSFERQILPLLTDSRLFSLRSRGYFVDIGTPAALARLRRNPKPLISVLQKRLI